jgi:hypothetical protein
MSGLPEWFLWLKPKDRAKAAEAMLLTSILRNRAIQRRRASEKARAERRVRRPYQDLPRAEARGE